jgi:hypothetical protein
MLFCSACGSSTQYVIWAATNLGMWVANGGSPTGPFSIVTTGPQPDGVTTISDQDAFVEPSTGIGYFVYHETAPTDQIVISKMNATMTSTTGIGGDQVILSSGSSREAPNIFKRGSTYFAELSNQDFYDSSIPIGANYMTCTGTFPCSGGWSGFSLALNQPGSDPYNGQISSIFATSGGSYMAIMDRWVQAPLVNTTPDVMMPVSFGSATAMVVQPQPAR